MIHNNFNVSNLEKSLEFYKKALNLVELRKIEREAFTLVFLGDNSSNHQLELTFLKNHPEKYDLGDNEIHLAFEVEDIKEAFKLHKELGIVVYENKPMGIYFIEDPDGYWLEILPAKNIKNDL